MIPTIDHITDGTSKVVSQYRGRHKFLARLACYLWQIQHIEDAIFAVRDAFNPDTATGFRLDWIGRKVGQPRLGDDTTYRALIQARIRVNRSQGKFTDLLAVAGILFSSFTYDEWGTTIQIYTSDAMTAEFREVAHTLLQRAAPGGVPIYLLQSSAPAFEFAIATADMTVPGGFDTAAGLSTAGLWSYSL
jgi:hypothetical protein